MMTGTEEVTSKKDGRMTTIRCKANNIRKGTKRLYERVKKGFHTTKKEKDTVVQEIYIPPEIDVWADRSSGCPAKQSCVGDDAVRASSASSKTSSHWSTESKEEIIHDMDELDYPEYHNPTS